MHRSPTVFFGLQDAPPEIWEENGGASYNPNVGYLACHRGPGGGGGGAGFFCFFLFSPPKPRYVLWSGVSYSLKNMVLHAGL